MAHILVIPYNSFSIPFFTQEATEKATKTTNDSVEVIPSVIEASEKSPDIIVCDLAELNSFCSTIFNNNDPNARKYRKPVIVIGDKSPHMEFSKSVVPATYLIGRMEGHAPPYPKTWKHLLKLTNQLLEKASGPDTPSMFKKLLKKCPAPKVGNGYISISSLQPK